MRATILLLLLLFTGGLCPAQYPPQAGIGGSTAIAAADARFRDWASACTVARGYKDIAVRDSGRVSQGDGTLVPGPADAQVVSLGDSGVAVVTFSYPVQNGEGPDFAVFENGFPNPLNEEEAFLELAFVEVSSDGSAFTRFPAVSLVPASPQLSSVAGAGYINARQLQNLAGKYRSGWGTPFDLQELAGTPGLDVNAITAVRIVDVIGAVNGAGSKDADGRPVNDPYPTRFATGGFDLDAVGVIHNTAPASVAAGNAARPSFYPNPAGDYVVVSGIPDAWSWHLVNPCGQAVLVAEQKGDATISLRALPAGLYFFTIRTKDGAIWHERLVKQ